MQCRLLLMVCHGYICSYMSSVSGIHLLVSIKLSIRLSMGQSNFVISVNRKMSANFLNEYVNKKLKMKILILLHFLMAQHFSELGEFRGQKY